MFQRKVRLFAALICAVVLTACSHPQLIDLGQSQEVVQNQLGKPDTVSACAAFADNGADLSGAAV